MVFDVQNYEEFKAAMTAFSAFLEELQMSAERAFDSKLVLHELLGNVLQHSDEGARLCVEAKEGTLHITVRGGNGFCPPAKGVCPPACAERGRGLFLVDEFAERSVTKDGEIFVRIRIL